MLLDIARVLRVDVEALIGRPWQLAPNGGPVADGLDDVRRVFTHYDHLLGAESEPTVPLVQLRAGVVNAHRDYQAARYQSVIAQLPELLTNMDGLHRAALHPDRREMLLAYVSAYVATAKLLTKLGATDLAWLAADRAATAAVDADSLSARGMAAYQVVCALLRADRTDDAEHLAVLMAEQVHASARSDEPALVSVAGALWLIAAVIAARRTDRGEAWRRLDVAGELAGMLGGDANHAWTAFGPTNVAIHRVSVAAELGDAGVPATEVARRAGHGVAVMLKVYANCVDGDEPIMNERIERALRTGHGRLDVAEAVEADANPVAHPWHADQGDHGLGGETAGGGLA